MNSTLNTLSFCGLDIRLNSKIIEWKIKDDVIQGWKDSCTASMTDRKENTPKHVMMLFGYLNRLAYVRLESNYRHRSILQHISKISRTCSSDRKQWSKKDRLSTTTYTNLANIIREIDFKWSSIKKHKFNHPILLATDASEKYIGFVLLHKHTDSWTLLEQDSELRTEELSIDFGETLATHWASQKIKKHKTPDMDCLIIAIDNTASSRSLLRGASHSDEINDLIQATLDTLLTEFEETQIGILDIASADNVSDVLTRSRDISPSNEDYTTRLNATIKRAEIAIKQLELSIRWTSRHDI